jgi:hypothetical protein
MRMPSANLKRVDPDGAPLAPLNITRSRALFICAVFTRPRNPNTGPFSDSLALQFGIGRTIALTRCGCALLASMISPVVLTPHAFKASNAVFPIDVV